MAKIFFILANAITVFCAFWMFAQAVYLNEYEINEPCEKISFWVSIILGFCFLLAEFTLLKIYLIG